MAMLRNPNAQHAAIASTASRCRVLRTSAKTSEPDTQTAQTTTAASTSAATTAADTSQRFLKLLVTQMQNQDPLNPTDNAQITSQMAQINTVEGISQLNTTMGDFSGRAAYFVQWQTQDGRVIIFIVDASSGQVLSRQGG
jgi:flagellar basal-body rod modification protein FlgD